MVLCARLKSAVVKQTRNTQCLKLNFQVSIFITANINKCLVYIFSCFALHMAMSDCLSFGLWSVPNFGSWMISQELILYAGSLLHMYNTHVKFAYIIWCPWSTFKVTGTNWSTFGFRTTSYFSDMSRSQADVKLYRMDNMSQLGRLLAICFYVIN